MLPHILYTAGQTWPSSGLDWLVCQDCLHAGSNHLAKDIHEVTFQNEHSTSISYLANVS